MNIALLSPKTFCHFVLEQTCIVFSKNKTFMEGDSGKCLVSYKQNHEQIKHQLQFILHS